ncbi:MULTISPECIES: hypothetical protein [unclassified Bradyrhizobium]|uniref:hypothetical protein n=1 Tax=unclassified Bradyrhizobium TaxID=2631580 RepID=UPI0028EC8D8D|nr:MULTISPECIES: hypothetical protein [unclassified Bradyrhizobium]
MFYQTSADRTETAGVSARRVPWGAKAALVALALTMRMNAPRAEEIDFGPYRAAAQYCAGEFPLRLALSPDRRILCFDGLVHRDQDLSLVNRLQPGGLFVVRSQGGDDVAMMRLADRLSDLDATVVVRGYCLIGCANYLVFASRKTIVLRDGLVAWRPRMVDGFCLGFRTARDGGLPRFDIGHCRSTSPAESLSQELDTIYATRRKFMSLRVVNRQFEEPPESIYIRRTLSNINRSNPNGLAGLMWTWHPRYHQSSVATEIVYERYPESQEEVAALAQQLPFDVRVIYDP